MIIQLGNFGGGGGTGSGVTPSQVNALINSAITQGQYINDAEYISSAKTIVLYQDSTEVATIDATAFIKDGMVDSVTVSGSILTIVFNTDAGKEPINVDLSSIVDLSNYWTSAQTEGAIAQAVSGYQPITGMTAYTTNHDFALHSGNTDIHVTAQEKAAWNAKQDASAMTEYCTSAQTQSAISGAVLTKQDTLISGQNIKTINNESLLGSGNITIGGGGSSNIVELTQAEYDALATKDPDTLYIITDAQAINLSGYAQTSAVTAEIAAAVSGKADTSAVTQSLSSKQDVLVSGTNIKTINSQSLLGSGNITIGGGGGSYVYYSEDTENQTATIHIEDADNGTTGEVYVCSSDAGVYASRTGEEEGSTIERLVNSNITADGVTIAYEKSVDGQPTAQSYLYVQEDGISLEVSNDADRTTEFAVSNSAVTVNGENVVTENQLADYQPVLTAGTGIDITNNVISATGGGGVTVDPSLDSGSTNPVANSAITNGFNKYTLKRNSENGEVRYFYVSSPAQPYGGGGQLFSNFSINGRCPLTQTNGTNSYIDKFYLVETSAITTSITSASTNTEVAGAKAVYDQLGGLKFVRCTQAQYDAMVSGGTVDADTVYFIVSGS